MHQRDSHTPPVQIWRRCWETTQPYTRGEKHPPPGRPVLDHLTLYDIDDETPTEGDIKVEVR